jgi:hypothetical protein
MDHASSKDFEEAVKGLKGEFAQWRRRRKGRERIPERLWDEAVVLARVYGIGAVSNALKLDFYRLKDRIRRATMASAEGMEVSTGGFIEIAGPGFGTATGMVVDLCKANGAWMQIMSMACLRPPSARDGTKSAVFSSGTIN